MEDTNFIKALRENADKCRNMFELCLVLGIDSIGGNTYKEIQKIAKENGITLSFSGKIKKTVARKKTLNLKIYS